ncbi:SpoIIE family protein phosphatase [Streptomyces sp. NPDC056242]|uniref:SpoIIE family protein phosphatase n=1 Tax=Streptomyces sp. NPDC056242 TaxID=3345760 RepID=UPI0035D8162B
MARKDWPHGPPEHSGRGQLRAGSDLPVRRLRPGHPAVHAGPGRSPATCHLPPATVAADGTVAFPDVPTGPPPGLGFLPFESAELELPDGTLLTLFTNGLIGAGDRDVDPGLNCLAEALAAPAPTSEDVCENVTGALLTGPPSDDDGALLLARTHGLDAGQVASWNLACDPAVVADSRALAVRRLAPTGAWSSCNSLRKWCSASWSSTPSATGQSPSGSG